MTSLYNNTETKNNIQRQVPSRRFVHKNGQQRHSNGGGGGPSMILESNGPAGKVRGTAQQLVEKYILLANDANRDSDAVAMESFLQYAEHYRRMVADFPNSMVKKPGPLEIEKQLPKDNQTERSEKTNTPGDSLPLVGTSSTETSVILESAKKNVGDQEIGNKNPSIQSQSPPVSVNKNGRKSSGENAFQDNPSENSKKPMEKNKNHKTKKIILQKKNIEEKPSENSLSDISHRGGGNSPVSTDSSEKKEMLNKKSLENNSSNNTSNPSLDFSPPDSVKS